MAPVQPTPPVQPTTQARPTIPVPAVPVTVTGQPAGLMKPARRRPVLIAAAAVAVVAVLVVTTGFGSHLPFAADTGSPGVVPEPSYPAVVKPPLVELTPVGSTPVAADGSNGADANGVTVALAADSLVNASALQLVASDLPAAFDSSLLSQDGWKRTSKAYSLELDKDSDVIGGVPLSFPASSSSDRVAVLMDRRYMIVLGVTPVDGRLTVQAATGSAVSPAFEGESDYYFVVSKAGAATAPDGLAVARVASLDQGADGGGVPSADASATCTYSSFIPTTTCWNAAKSISFTSATKLDSDWEARVSAFLDRSGAIVAKYKSLGFVRADPTPDDPIRIVIDSDPGADPRYSPNLFTTPKIYVGFRTVFFADNPGEQQLMAHELFHWVQHHTYPMRIDGNIAVKYWRSETQAEAASFMVDPGYQAARLLKVASQVQKEGTSGVLGWQKTGGEWDQNAIGRPNADPSRYVQGQVVALGLCDGPTCIESRQAFIDEVNGGLSILSAISYPLGLENTARYLLGTAPTGITVDLTAPILRTGRGIGDYIHLNQKPGRYYDYADISNVTNETKTAASGEVAIHASIAGNALYPFRVSNGSDMPLDGNCLPDSNRFSGTQLSPNAPNVLHLEAGVELYWRIGDGPLQHSDGSKPTDIGPITSESSVAVQLADHTWTTKPGIPSVRIVAVNQSKDPVTLGGSVAPQAPKMVATPEKIDKADPNTAVQLRVDMTQVALNFAGATAEWDFGDGSPAESAKITPDAKLTASVSTTHTFKATSAGVRVTFRDKAGKPLAWDPVNIPVTTVAPTASAAPTATATAATKPSPSTTAPGSTRLPSKTALSGRWVLTIEHGKDPNHPIPLSTETAQYKTTIESSNGRIAITSKSLILEHPHWEGTFTWGPPPASVAPGDIWTTTFSAQMTCGADGGAAIKRDASLSERATWTEATLGTLWVDVTCQNGSASKDLSIAFPTYDPAWGPDYQLKIFVGTSFPEDMWTYVYTWQP